MKQAILIFLVVATLATALSLATIGSPRTVTLDFLPKTMTKVPMTYFAATLALIFSVLGLTLIGRGWESDALPPIFVEGTKAWAVSTLLLSILPAVIFLSVVFQELRR